MESRAAPSSGALVKTSVQLPPDQVEAVAQLAARKRTRPSAVVRELLAMGLREQQRIDELTEVVSR